MRPTLGVSLHLKSRRSSKKVKMHLQKLVSLLAGSAYLAAAAPVAEGRDPLTTGLRLIKTSPEDPGVWVTEEEKISEYTAKGKHFIDITDITV